MIDMKPELGDTTVSLPVTFDYHGGRVAERKHIWLQAIVTVVLVLFLCILVFQASKPLYLRLIIVGVIIFATQWFLRFVTFKEAIYSNAYERLKEDDFTPSTSTFWGIFDIDNEYPYIAHFKSGISGVFVMLEKDVIVGKPETIMYDHYEAISQAYNTAAHNNIGMVQIDYMENVGNDPRLRQMFAELNNCNNQEMRDMMLSLYSHLQEEMSLNYASYDVYLFYCRGKTDNLWYNSTLVLNDLLNGNYLSYKALDIEGVRKSCMGLFNLEDFSAVDACNKAFDNSNYRGIVPIELMRVDGESVKLNKTVAEKQEEARQRAEEERLEHERRQNMTLKEKLGLDKIKSKNTKYNKGTNKVNNESNEELKVFKAEEQNTDKDEDLNLFDDNEKPSVEETGDEDLDVFEDEEKNETEPKVTIEVGTADEDLDIFD